MGRAKRQKGMHEFVWTLCVKCVARGSVKIRDRRGVEGETGRKKKERSLFLFLPTQFKFPQGPAKKKRGECFQRNRRKQGNM